MAGGVREGHVVEVGDGIVVEAVRNCQMGRHAVIEPKGKLTGRTLGVLFLIKRTGKGRGVAHKLVRNRDGLALRISIDIANRDALTDVTGEEGVDAIGSGRIGSGRGGCAGDFGKPKIGVGVVVDSQVGDVGCRIGDGQGRRRQGMDFILCRVVFAGRCG